MWPIAWRCIWRKCKVTAESHWLLTVMPVTGPGTRLLCHGEQSVGDIGQKAVKVEHVGLHRHGLGFRVHLIGPLLQLCLADLTLECIKHSLNPSNQLWATHKSTKKNLTRHTGVRICCTNHPILSIPISMTTVTFLPCMNTSQSTQVKTQSLLQRCTCLFRLVFSPSLKPKTLREEGTLPLLLPWSSCAYPPLLSVRPHL